MSEISYTVPGMRCGHGERAVSAELRQVGGVESVQVHLETPRDETSRPRPVDDGSLPAEIEEAG